MTAPTPLRGTTLIAGRRTLLLGGLAAALPGTARAQGATIHVMSSGSFTAAYQRLGPEFERRTGHRLVNAFGASLGEAQDALPQRLARGEPADVVFALLEGIEALAAAGHLDLATRVDLAETRIAFAVRAGAPRPDMSTVEGVRRTLLAASSIAHSPSGSGLYYERELLERLGIADQVRPKSRRILSERIGTVVARGDAELGLQQISELLPIPGIEIIRIPDELQRVSIAAAALARRAQQPEAARQLVAFLTSSAAAETIAATGLDPIRR
jgi:molybdate transport system substrate-binding protein